MLQARPFSSHCGISWSLTHTNCCSGAIDATSASSQTSQENFASQRGLGLTGGIRKRKNNRKQANTSRNRRRGVRTFGTNDTRSSSVLMKRASSSRIGLSLLKNQFLTFVTSWREALGLDRSCRWARMNSSVTPISLSDVSINISLGLWLLTVLL